MSTLTEGSFDEGDVADALFNRGAFLRKLREMEAQDEAERLAADQESCSGSSSSDVMSEPDNDTLYYPKYLAKQKYYDDYKHINYKYIDFGYPEQKPGETDYQHECKQQHQQLPLLIEQDKSVGKGGHVWDAAVILADHFLHEKPEWQKVTTSTTTSSSNSSSNSRVTNMVELGAGTGVTGLMVAQALPEEVHIGLTDLPLLMPLLEKNLAHNDNPPNASAFVLEWGGTVSSSYDVILGADVVAGIYDAFGLAKTIFELAHERTLVYISINKRFQEPIEEFQSAMTKFFDQIEIRPSVSRNKNPNVSILVATGKRSNQ